jgi:rfaE bifunctional protein kinase chain/domain
MDRSRFNEITGKYPSLRVALVGDLCLDRYLEIDPSLQETSLETGLPVHNIVNTRSQPGASGTIINNLSALGLSEIWPVAFAGEDGEGFELVRALRRVPGVRADFFLKTPLRRTFTYTKPLLMHPGRPPEELSRLDQKNWTRTPAEVESHLVRAIQELAPRVDALILLDQVDEAGTGVITKAVLEAVEAEIQKRPNWLVLADSRHGFYGYPPVSFKMNRQELANHFNNGDSPGETELDTRVAILAKELGRAMFVTLSEKGLMGSSAQGVVERVPCLPVRGPIDIVGAGDSVTANLVAALLAGAGVRESLELAAAASSVVVHQLGTTGVARVADLEERLFAARSPDPGEFVTERPPA